MGQRKAQSSSRLWALARSQHGVVARSQLLDLGLNSDAIQHRIERRRLHQLQRGVYAVGEGSWMAAVLSCGPNAVLSHASAAALWEIRSAAPRRVEVSVPAHTSRRRPGIAVHRRANLDSLGLTRHRGIPVTTPVCTLIDLATRLAADELEAAINEADKRGLTTPDQLRSALDAAVPRPGTATLRSTLDEHTFTRTDSHLERRLLRLVRQAGLPPPKTQHELNGHHVDFYWPELKLVVETDGLTYHRTPAQQAADRLRDQAHTAAGLTTLRFTHAQVVHDPDHVRTTLTIVARRRR
jgi:very-short-patch-repair endonuclease